MGKPRKARFIGQEVEVPQLPEAAVINILRHVPLEQRLASCALVCRMWAAAAAWSTTSVDTEFDNAEKCQQFRTWMQRCSDRLCSIRAGQHGLVLSTHVLQLPCRQLPQLQSLDLEWFNVFLHNPQGHIRTRSSTNRSCTLTFQPSSGSGSAAQGQHAEGFLPQLQHLGLQDCRVPYKNFSQLSQLTRLTSLSLARLRLATNECFTKNIHDSFVADDILQLLLHLTGLVTLQLRGFDFSLAQLAPISAMQVLQRLEVRFSELRGSLPMLPATLTALVLDSSHSIGVRFSLATVPHASQLSNLRQLELRGVILQPSILCNWPKLQRLCLESVWAADSDAEDEAAGGDSQAPDLVNVLGQLPELQHLSLAGVRPFSPDASSCAALAASSHLTALRFDGRQSGFLPAGALQHMLSPGKLPHLQVLQLAAASHLERAEGFARADAAVIRSIAACCPALEKLELRNVVSTASAVSSLAQLQPLLTSLSVAGSGFDDSAAPVVAQLTRLRSLSWGQLATFPRSLTKTGVQALTALQGLTELHLWWIVNHNPVLTLRAEAGAPPDVCKQLQTLLSTDSTCGSADAAGGTS